MAEGQGPDSGPHVVPGQRRLLIANVLAMAAGLLFLITACALLGWRFAVGPVPRIAGIAAAVLGFLCGTAIVVASALYYRSTKKTKQQS
jgi:hypothetical protein